MTAAEQEAVLDALMVKYDKCFPDAPQFARNTYRHEKRNAIEDISRLGCTILMPGELTPKKIWKILDDAGSGFDRGDKWAILQIIRAVGWS
jgi:hypothetical protein